MAIRRTLGVIDGYNVDLILDEKHRPVARVEISNAMDPCGVSFSIEGAIALKDLLSKSIKDVEA